ncbi:MAG: helix-turn-helix domain-containing protein [Acidimicrobiales bacterium]
MAGSKRQEQAAATQQQLLDAARTLFTERGYQGTSVAAITDAANTAHGTFYLYFRNKEDAFTQLMASAMEELYRLTLTQLEPGEPRRDPQVVRERVALYLRTAQAHGRLLRALLEPILVSPRIEASWLELRGRFQGRSPSGCGPTRRSASSRARP